VTRSPTLALPATDLVRLKERVRRLAEDRPGVYRMLDPRGRVIYVGKAKQVRTRLLSYFRADHPDEKAARILNAAADIVWDYVPSEFAAYLGELRQIVRHRPMFNQRMNRTRKTLFIRVQGGSAPKVSAGGPLDENTRCYGPFISADRVRDAVRGINDLLGLRDCAPNMPMVFAGQTDLFGVERRAACMRHDFGFCTGPCAGFVTEREYLRRVDTAVAFLEGRTIQPLDRVINEMQQAADAGEFEKATLWRERFERLEWLLAAIARARTAVDGLSFVYRDPGLKGDDRAYLIRQGVVLASYPFPSTPIEQEAFRAVVKDALSAPAPSSGPLPSSHLDEILLVMSWFRRHPQAFRRTTPLNSWVA
jgi:excinuclease ABC subunit C